MIKLETPHLQDQHGNQHQTQPNTTHYTLTEHKLIHLTPQTTITYPQTPPTPKQPPKNTTWDIRPLFQPRKTT